jgi:uncharacterized membrane protein YphA (DoxX/SURF4 family)
MVGRFLLRATIGAIFVEHGTQKLFGWFGGGGPDGTGQFFESLGLRPAGGPRWRPASPRSAAGSFWPPGSQHRSRRRHSPR